MASHDAVQPWEEYKQVPPSVAAALQALVAKAGLRDVKEAAEELGSSHEAARRPAPPRPCRTRLACRACAPAGCNATRRLVCALQAACSGGARATQIHLVLHETVRWKAEGWDR